MRHSFEAPPRKSIGADIGGSSIKLVRLAGNRVEDSLELKTPSGPPERILEALAESIERLNPPGVKRASGRSSPPRGPPEGGNSPPRGPSEERKPLPVGIAVPGFIDPTRARVVRLANLPALNGVRLKDEIRKRIRAPVLLDTDTNAAAIAEARLGAGRRYERVLYLSMGTGVGAALVVGGELVRVSHHTVGQVAHIPLSSSGPRCYCGNRGCAETLLSARGILWRARGAGIRGVASTESLWESARSPLSKAERVRVLRVWEEVGGLVGQLLCIMASLFSPDVAVLGGGVAGASRLFLPAARRHVRLCLAPALRAKIVLEPAQNGKLAGAIGVALMALASQKE